MKALIVIEIDENHLLKEMNELYDRLNGYKCDLIPMPQKRPVSYTDNIFGEVEKNFNNIGWNDCIDEIIGETE